MLRNENQSQVNFAARVPKNELRALESILQATSGKTWFIRVSLEQFNSLCEADPVVRREVLQKILAYRNEEPERGLVPFLPRVPIDEYKRFNQMFPEKGATTWFIRTLLKEYLKNAESRPTPDQYLLEAVRGIVGLPPQI